MSWLINKLRSSCRCCGLLDAKLRIEYIQNDPAPTRRRTLPLASPRDNLARASLHFAEKRRDVAENPTWAHSAPTSGAGEASSIVAQFIPRGLVMI